ncbi:MAG: DUF6011 domain-containing protein, partial [Myxococcota bacterium]|nr:DUF6011 domain-containing protein [Myxococcota bacterium]
SGRYVVVSRVDEEFAKREQGVSVGDILVEPFQHDDVSSPRYELRIEESFQEKPKNDLPRKLFGSGPDPLIIGEFPIQVGFGDIKLRSKHIATYRLGPVFYELRQRTLLVRGLKDTLKEDNLKTKGFLLFPNPAPPKDLFSASHASEDDQEETTAAETSDSQKGSSNCLLCQRELTDPESQGRGVGPICFGNLKLEEEVEPENLEHAVGLLSEAAAVFRVDPLRAAEIAKEVSELGATTFAAWLQARTPALLGWSERTDFQERVVIEGAGPQLTLGAARLLTAVIRSALPNIYRGADDQIGVGLHLPSNVEDNLDPLGHEDCIVLYDLAEDGSGAVSSLFRDSPELLLRVCRMTVERVLYNSRLSTRYDYWGNRREILTGGDAVSLRTYGEDVERSSSQKKAMREDQDRRVALLDWLDSRLRAEGSAITGAEPGRYTDFGEPGEGDYFDYGRCWYSETGSVRNLMWSKLRWLRNEDMEASVDVGFGRKTALAASALFRPQDESAEDGLKSLIEKAKDSPVLAHLGHNLFSDVAGAWFWNPETQQDAQMAPHIKAAERLVWINMAAAQDWKALDKLLGLLVERYEQHGKKDGNLIHFLARFVEGMADRQFTAGEPMTPVQVLLRGSGDPVSKATLLAVMLMRCGFESGVFVSLKHRRAFAGCTQPRQLEGGPDKQPKTPAPGQRIWAVKDIEKGRHYSPISCSSLGAYGAEPVCPQPEDWTFYPLTAALLHLGELSHVEQEFQEAQKQLAAEAELNADGVEVVDPDDESGQRDVTEADVAAAVQELSRNPVVGTPEPAPSSPPKTAGSSRDGTIGQKLEAMEADAGLEDAVNQDRPEAQEEKPPPRISQVNFLHPKAGQIFGEGTDVSFIFTVRLENGLNEDVYFDHVNLNLKKEIIRQTDGSAVVARLKSPIANQLPDGRWQYTITASGLEAGGYRLRVVLSIEGHAGSVFESGLAFAVEDTTPPAPSEAEQGTSPGPEASTESVREEASDPASTETPPEAASAEEAEAPESATEEAVEEQGLLAKAWDMIRSRVAPSDADAVKALWDEEWAPELDEAVAGFVEGLS